MSNKKTISKNDLKNVLKEMGAQIDEDFVNMMIDYIEGARTSREVRLTISALNNEKDRIAMTALFKLVRWIASIFF